MPFPRVQKVEELKKYGVIWDFFYLSILYKSILVFILKFKNIKLNFQTQPRNRGSWHFGKQKNHPDLNPGNKKAEAKFKDISHANDLIGTIEAKEKFDRGEVDQEHPQYQPKRGHGRRSNGPKADRYSQSFAEQFAEESFFEDLFNNRGKQQPINRDTHYQMPISFKESIVDRTKLRFKGQGEQATNGQGSSDAYIEISVTPEANWTRNGLDIETEIAISFIEAITGATISIPTMHGAVMLTIPAGVSSGTKLRIKGKGIQKEQGVGHQIVTLKIVMPKKISAELTTAIEEWKGVFNYNPRGES